MFPFIHGVYGAGVIPFYDTFTAANGTNLTAHTPDNDISGNGWTAVSQTWTIQSNQAQHGGSGTVGIATFDVSLADGTITAIINTNTGTSLYAGVAFRYSDSSNYWRAIISMGDNFMLLQKIVAGTPSTVTSGAVTIDPDIAYTIIVTLDGNAITATVTGLGTPLSTSDAFNASATTCGLYSNYGNRYLYDSILMEA